MNVTIYDLAMLSLIFEQISISSYFVAFYGYIYRQGILLYLYLILTLKLRYYIIIANHLQ